MNKIKSLGSRYKLSKSNKFIKTQIYMIEYDNTFIRRLIKNMSTVNKNRFRYVFKLVL